MLLFLSISCIISIAARGDQGDLIHSKRRVSQLGYSSTFLDEHECIQAYSHDELLYTTLAGIFSEVVLKKSSLCIGNEHE